MNRKKNFLSLFVLVLSLCVLAVGGYYVWQALSGFESTESPIIQKGAYYSIRKNATDLQIDLYSELITAIEQQQEDTEVAGLVAQNFVADFFTITNKYKINDIGGLQFVDERLQTSVYSQVKDTFFAGLIDYIGLDDVTLEVASITVESSTFIDYELLGDENEDGERAVTPLQGVEVFVSWTYLDSSVLDTTAYDHDARIVLLKSDSGLYYVVEVNDVQA